MSDELLDDPEDPLDIEESLDPDDPLDEDRSPPEDEDDPLDEESPPDDNEPDDELRCDPLDDEPDDPLDRSSDELDDVNVPELEEFGRLSLDEDVKEFVPELELDVMGIVPLEECRLPVRRNRLATATDGDPDQNNASAQELLS